jgi:hypothetical protein
MTVCSRLKNPSISVKAAREKSKPTKKLIEWRNEPEEKDAGLAGALRDGGSPGGS